MLKFYKKVVQNRGDIGLDKVVKKVKERKKKKEGRFALKSQT